MGGAFGFDTWWYDATNNNMISLVIGIEGSKRPREREVYEGVRDAAEQAWEGAAEVAAQLLESRSAELLIRSRGESGALRLSLMEAAGAMVEAAGLIRERVIGEGREPERPDPRAAGGLPVPDDA